MDSVLNQKELNTSHFSMKILCFPCCSLSLFIIDTNFNILFGEKNDEKNMMSVIFI